MSDHTPTPTQVTEHSETIHGYDYGTDQAGPSPLTLDDLHHLREVVGLTDDDTAALNDAARIPFGCRRHAEFGARAHLPSAGSARAVVS